MRTLKLLLWSLAFWKTRTWTFEKRLQILLQCRISDVRRGPVRALLLFGRDVSLLERFGLNHHGETAKAVFAVKLARRM